MTIHKEGTATLLITAISLMIILGLGYYLAPDNNLLHTFLWIVAVILFLTVLQFFRKPTRKTPINPNHIIAPADGKVVVIEEVEETEYFKERAKERYKIEAKNSELKHRHGYDVASSSGLIGMELQGALTIFAVNLKRIIRLSK